MNESGSSNRKLFTYARYQPDSSGVITQSGPSSVSFRPNTHLERRDFTSEELPCCSTEAACDSPPPNIVLRMASDWSRVLLSDRRCSADIYPHQLYHQVINTTLVTIVVGKRPDYPWIGRGEPTTGGGGSSSYWHNGIKQRWQWQFYILQESISRWVDQKRGWL